MTDYIGRGAWSRIGVGGTLKNVNGKSVPGPYYQKPSKGVPAPGVFADDLMLAGMPRDVIDLNSLAVWYGVLAIKVRLQEMTGLISAESLTLNGRYGPGVVQAVKDFQTNAGVTADGAVGPATAKSLFRPVVEEIGTWSVIGPTIGCGIVTNESAWDPGAVGFVDSGDHGLVQLNADSQGFTLDASFNARTAITQMYRILDSNLVYFDGVVTAAIAAYNLGKAGCQLWMSEGRPQMFVPLSQRPNGTARDVWAYINRIETACA
jgi:peptidoglycan hydrolase-like protein with peptidoglycan-binding domain